MVDILLISFDIFWQSCDYLVTILWLSCDLLVPIKWLSCDYLVTIMWLSCDYLATILQTSCEDLMTILWISFDYLVANFWLSWEYSSNILQHCIFNYNVSFWKRKNICCLYIELSTISQSLGNFKTIYSYTLMNLRKNGLKSKKMT